MANKIRNNIHEQELKQTTGGVGTVIIVTPVEEHLVDKYSGIIGHVYTFKKPGYTFTGILLDSYEKKNLFFGTTRYHKVQVQYTWDYNFQEGSIVDINGDDFEMYES